MGKGPGGIERRQYARIKKNFIIRFFDKNNPSVKFEISQIENISRGGIGFTSGIPLEVGAELAIELRTPYLTETLHLEGTVLESTERVKGLIYFNRLKLHDVTPAAVTVLEKIELYNKNPKD